MPGIIKKVFILISITCPMALTPSCITSNDQGQTTPARISTAIFRILELEAQRQANPSSLEGICQQQNTTLRVRAIRALGRSQDPAHRYFIAQYLENKEMILRLEALTALIMLGPKAAAPGLPLLHSEISDLRRLATILAGRSQRPEIAPTLIGLLTDQSPLVRGEAALSLGQLVKSTSLEPNQTTLILDKLLIRSEKETNEAVLWRITWSLSHLVAGRKSESEPALQRLTNKRHDWRTRFFATRALSRLRPLSPQSQTLLCEMMKDDQIPLAVEAMLTLAWPGYPNLPRPPARVTAPHRPLDPTCLEIILKLAKSPETPPTIRQTACNCLGFQTNNQTALRQLMAAANAGDPLIEAAAITSLARSGGADFIPLLDRITTKSNWQLRQAAALASGLVDGKAALNLCLEAVRDKDPRVRLAAAAALGFHGHTRTGRMAARDLLGDPEPAITAAAARALNNTSGQSIAEAILKAWHKAPIGEIPLRRNLIKVINSSTSLAESSQARLIRQQATRDQIPQIRQLVDAPSRGTRLSPSPTLLLPAPAVKDLPAPGTTLHLTTQRGDLAIILNTEHAPIHAYFWSRLVKENKLKDRQVHNCDPTFGIKAFGSGKLGPGPVDRQGRLIADEISLQTIGAGTVIATSYGSPDSGTDGLFICLVPCPYLRGRSTVIGNLTPQSLKIARQLRAGDKILKAQLLK